MEKPVDIVEKFGISTGIPPISFFADPAGVCISGCILSPHNLIGNVLRKQAQEIIDSFFLLKLFRKSVMPADSGGTHSAGGTKNL